MRTPRRYTQASCIALVALGLLPWGLLTGNLLLDAVVSPLPLQGALAAWIAMLVPIWIAWFAYLAWRKRDETVVPAVLMAAPSTVIATLELLMPIALIMP